MGESEAILLENVEVTNIGEYVYDLEIQFPDIPTVARPLLKKAEKTLSKLEKMLYTAPTFIEFVKSSVPEEVYQAVLTSEQKEQLAKGALKLMTKKDGSLMATLVDTTTKKIAGTISIEKVNLSPDITETLTDYATQMQLAQIAEEIHTVQLAIEEVRLGQESDRLAIAYSCQQRLLQAMAMESPVRKEAKLLALTDDAETSRIMLMQSQYANLAYLKEQPESFFGKMKAGVNTEKINQRILEVRDNLAAVNMVSLIEAMAYQEMGESISARQSLIYYAEYLHKAYLETDGLVERLDMIDPSPENYWSKILPDIYNKIQALPCVSGTLALEGVDNEN